MLRRLLGLGGGTPLSLCQSINVFSGQKEAFCGAAPSLALRLQLFHHETSSPFQSALCASSLLLHSLLRR